MPCSVISHHLINVQFQTVMMPLLVIVMTAIRDLDAMSPVTKQLLHHTVITIID